jgi:hypothetical protein
MFWEEVEPNMTPRLETAVAQAYDVFAGYALAKPLIYCDCNVCMSDEVAVQLSTLPLRDIAANLLAEYTNSAHGYDRTDIEPQFKYFLPRYLDLIAHCDPPSDLGLETCLDRLSGYREHWPEPEVKAVDEFFDAFLEASVHQLLLLEWPVGLRLEFDMGELLGMVIRAGGDLERVLAVFDGCPDPAAAVHMSSMRSNVEMRGDTPHFRNAHYDDYPDAARRLAEWLGRDSVTERIMAAHDLLQDPDYDDILNMGI